jgi:hypothetical protein
MMTPEAFFVYVLIPLSMGANILIYGLFRRMSREQQKFSPEHYLLFAVVLVLFLLSLIQAVTQSW